MKTKYFAALAVTVSGLALSSCTSNSTAVTAADATYPVNQDLAERRVYTDEQLKKTGRTDNAGEGLAALDPSVRVHGR